MVRNHFTNNNAYYARNRISIKIVLILVEHQFTVAIALTHPHFVFICMIYVRDTTHFLISITAHQNSSCAHNRYVQLKIHDYFRLMSN
jgi:hypothetical protein